MIVIVVLLLGMIIMAGLPLNVLALSANTNQTDATVHSNGLRPLKVHMNSRSLWSDGGYTAEEMAVAAKNAGYDAIFFADSALNLQVAPLADPRFENVSAFGNFSDWKTYTLGSLNSLAYAGPSIESGNRSLYLEIQSSSDKTQNDGYAVASPLFPGGYNFSQIPISHPFLLSGLAFSTDVYIKILGRSPYHPKTTIPSDSGDNAWFYLMFRFKTGVVGGPYSGEELTLQLVWSNQVVDPFLIQSRSWENETNHKVIYFNEPPLGQWVNLNVNVTNLVREVWNSTIVDYWKLWSFDIGARSHLNALVTCYVDNVSLSSSQSSAILNARASILSSLSSSSLGVYAGYSIDPKNQPSMYVYNTTYLDQLSTYNMSNPEIWKDLISGVSSESGVVAFGPITPELRAFDDYLGANDAFGVQLMDCTSFDGISVARSIFGAGDEITFLAAREAVNTTDYNSTDTWSMRVFAQSASESDILNAISEGRSYMAVSNFTGEFDFNPYGFPVTSDLPIYIPAGQNVSLPIYFTKVTNNNGTGLVRVYQNDRLEAKIPYNSNASINFSDIMKSRESHFYVGVSDPINDSLLILSNPITVKIGNMIPGGALFIDNEQWTLESSTWNATSNKQSYQLTVEGPTGSEATLYLYSPVFSPYSNDTTQARWASLGDQRLDLGTLYNATTSTFIVHAKSSGKPIQLTINFDIPTNIYVSFVTSSYLTLYLVIIVPFAIAMFFVHIRTRLRRSRVRK